MNRTLTIAVSIAVLLLAGGRTFGDWIYNPSTGHWYSLTAPGLTWTEAETAAVARGGHLVAIGSAQEDAWVFAQFGTTSPFVLWIGIYQLPASGEPADGWVWSNGESVGYTNWLDDNPNNGGPGSSTNENFGHIYAAAQADAGFWNDIDVGPPAHIGPGVIERVTCPDDWVHNVTTGHWYRLSAAHPTRQGVQEEAIAFGGYLTAIGDAAENQWILDNLGPLSPNQGLTIGLFQPPCTPEPLCGWAWDNGEPLVYTNWRQASGSGPTEPNDQIAPGENAAYMHWINHPDRGTWYDAPSDPSQGQGVIERDTAPSTVAICPTVSEWGLVVMTCLTLVAGTMILMRARRAPA